MRKYVSSFLFIFSCFVFAVYNSLSIRGMTENWYWHIAQWVSVLLFLGAGVEFGRWLRLQEFHLVGDTYDFYIRNQTFDFHNFGRIMGISIWEYRVTFFPSFFTCEDVMTLPEEILQLDRKGVKINLGFLITDAGIGSEPIITVSLPARIDETKSIMVQPPLSPYILGSQRQYAPDCLPKELTEQIMRVYRKIVL